MDMGELQEIVERLKDEHPDDAPDTLIAKRA